MKIRNLFILLAAVMVSLLLVFCVQNDSPDTVSIPSSADGKCYQVSKAKIDSTIYFRNEASLRDLNARIKRLEASIEFHEIKVQDCLLKAQRGDKASLEAWEGIVIQRADYRDTHRRLKEVYLRKKQEYNREWKNYLESLANKNNFE